MTEHNPCAGFHYAPIPAGCISVSSLIFIERKIEIDFTTNIEKVTLKMNNLLHVSQNWINFILFMNRFYFIVCILSIALFVSCTKSNLPISIAGKINTIRITTNASQNVFIYRYYYNGDGTVNNWTLEKEDDPTYSKKAIFNYTSSKITINEIDSTGNQIRQIDYLLTANGLVDNTIHSFTSPVTIFSQKYYYDSNNQLTQSIRTFPAGTIDTVFYEFTDGNLITMKTSYSTSYYAYSYKSITNNIIPSSFGYLDQISTRNVYHEIRIKDIADPTTNILAQYYEYSLDANNRVSILIEHTTDNGVDNGDFTKMVYTYN